jgi:uncharacterized iron-regulated membrane protein
MVRKTSFWLHLSAGITAGVFIFIMAATGVVLSFERQIIEFIDWDIRFVSVPNNSQPRPVTELLEAVRRSGIGEPSAIVVRNQPQAATQLSIGRGQTVYVDPYSGAVRGVSSAGARNVFSQSSDRIGHLGRRLAPRLSAIGWLRYRTFFLGCSFSLA